MPVTLPDARHWSDEVLQALRLRALHGCELGFTETQMADLLGVARETVSRWWSAYAGRGLDALPHERRGRPLGSGRPRNAEQARHLIDRACKVALTNRTVTAVIIPEDVGESAAVESPPREHGAVFSGVGWTQPRVIPPPDEGNIAAVAQIETDIIVADAG